MLSVKWKLSEAKPHVIGKTSPLQVLYRVVDFSGLAVVS